MTERALQRIANLARLAHALHEDERAGDELDAQYPLSPIWLRHPNSAQPVLLDREHLPTNVPSADLARHLLSVRVGARGN